jgi:hypothetical protein
VATLVTAQDGRTLDLDSSPQTLVYNSNSTLNYIQIIYRASTYRQTFGYTLGKLTSISGWIKQ